jgi:hypothetical protein
MPYNADEAHAAAKSARRSVRGIARQRLGMVHDALHVAGAPKFGKLGHDAPIRPH